MHNPTLCHLTLFLTVYIPRLTFPKRGAFCRRSLDVGEGWRLRAGLVTPRSGGPGQPSARTMTGCLQWLDARDTKGGGSRPDRKGPKGLSVRPRGSTVYGD